MVKQRTARDRELDELHEQHDRERARELRQARQHIADVLSNDTGFERLRAITDEEWAAAELEGEEITEEAGGAA